MSIIQTDLKNGLALGNYLFGNGTKPENAEFKETDHPRSKDGKFGAGGKGEAKKEEAPKEAEKPKKKPKSKGLYLDPDEGTHPLYDK